MKILVVEDNERVTRFLQKGLAEAGHTTDHADNGRDGLFLAASEHYDVIIMDRMLPGSIDGLSIVSALRQAGKRMDLLSRKVVRGARTIVLQPREFKLLEYLMRHAGQVVTRTMLLENVWDYHFDPQTNVVDVHISKLRQKIDVDSEHPLLRTVRNAGYMLSENG